MRPAPQILSCISSAENGIARLAPGEENLAPAREKWLERARAFAMHAIGQYHRFKAEYGQGWYGLWTGDLGFAIYLQQCITTEGVGFPTTDFF